MTISRHLAIATSTLLAAAILAVAPFPAAHAMHQVKTLAAHAMQIKPREKVTPFNNFRAYFSPLSHEGEYFTIPKNTNSLAFIDVPNYTIKDPELTKTYMPNLNDHLDFHPNAAKALLMNMQQARRSRAFHATFWSLGLAATVGIGVGCYYRCVLEQTGQHGGEDTIPLSLITGTLQP